MKDAEWTEFTKPLELGHREELVPNVGSDYDFIFIIKAKIFSRDSK